MDSATVVDCIAGGEDTGDEVMGCTAGDGTTCIAGGVDTGDEVKPVPGNC